MVDGLGLSDWSLESCVQTFCARACHRRNPAPA